MHFRRGATVHMNELHGKAFNTGNIQDIEGTELSFSTYVFDSMSLSPRIRFCTMIILDTAFSRRSYSRCELHRSCSNSDFDLHARLNVDNNLLNNLRWRIETIQR